MTATPRSLAEIASTGLKAVRGAGCPWGLAEEAGSGVRRLESTGASGCKALAKLLKSPRSCKCSGTGSAACGLFEMACLLDDPPDAPITVGPVVAPLLLAVPFLDAPMGWRLDWGSGGAIAGGGGLAVTGEAVPDAPVTVTLSPTEELMVNGPDNHASRAVDDDVWQRLEAFAARVYVPETAASRASGAGPD